MKAALFLPVLLLLLPAAASSLNVYVAPLLYIDETAIPNQNVNVQSDLLSALWAVETGVILQFRSLRDNRVNPPQSLTDAVAVSRHERIEYLLYGYVVRRDHSVQMEIRLSDYNHRRVAQTFFSMDDSDNYHRMINDMALKVIAHMNDVFNLGIMPERTGTTRISVPVSLGYWTPTQSSWTQVMFGTVVGGSGFELIPNDNLFTFRGMAGYLSTGIDLKYRFGVGDPSTYQAYKHTMYITIPARINLVLARQHEVFVGLGVVYFLDIFSMADRYADRQTHLFNNMGMNINFGYRFAFNEGISIFFRNDFDSLFNKRTLVSYSPVIGVNIQVFSREIVNRW